MSERAEPTDAELVARVLGADREAFAAVYDRYGPRLYDFAYAMLRHREDAADAVADSFVRFAEKLPQLREPDRLRPWLYAITRSECLRRLKARKRVSYGDDEQLMAMPDDGPGPEAAAERAMLTALVWDAAAGLADRDRALLDLHLRQGLEGAELGEAMGVSAANAYVMLNRLRAQVDRSMGALLIARLGREDCSELDTLLTDWDGTFSPLIRKRVARHVEGCTTCSERRTKILSPWVLLAGVPVFVAPRTLRDRVLTETQLVASSGPARTGGGWSTRTKGSAAVAALVAAASVTAVVVWPDGGQVEEAAAPISPSTSISAEPPANPTSTPAPVPSPTAVPPATPAAPASPATPSPEPTVEPGVEPGTILLSTTAINLGARGTRDTVTLSNPGGEPVAFTVSSEAAWLSAAPTSGSITDGAATDVAVRADRDRVAEGRSSGRIRIAWSGGSAVVTVTLSELNAPVVGRPTAPDPTCSQQTVPVRVQVTDQSRLTQVQLRWTGPNGSASRTMSRDGTAWTAQMGPFTLGGPVTFRVVATDRFGSTTTGPAQTVDATPCPG